MQVRFTGPCLAPQGVDGGAGLEDLDTSLDQRHTGIHLLGPIQLVDVVFLRSHLQMLPPCGLERASQDGFGFSVRHGMHSLASLHSTIQLYKLNCSKLIHYILRLIEFTPKIWVDRSIVVF